MCTDKPCIWMKSKISAMPVRHNCAVYLEHQARTASGFTCGCWSLVMHTRGMINVGAASDVMHNLHQQGKHVDSHTYVKMLQTCMEIKDLALGRQVHDHITRNQVQPYIYVVNTLIKMYSLCGSLVEARQVFDQFLKRDVVSWNAMVGGYARHGHVREAFTLFCRMQREGLEPNRITYMSILNACASPAALEWGKEVHTQATKAGFMSDVSVGNAFVNMYANCGSMKNAYQVFNKMLNRDVISWTTMIRGYTGSGHGEEAYKVFQQMQRAGLEPNKITYLSILSACASSEAMDWGKEVHVQAIQAGYGSDVRVGNALVNMYAKCGSIKDARQVFDRMTIRNVASWNTMIGRYAESGYGEEAFELLRRMNHAGFQPDRITYLCILSACGSPAALEWGKEIHAQAMKSGFARDLRVGNALVNMYAKCASIENARQVFDNMVKHDVISWTSIIGGYAASGDVKEAFKLFQQMLQEGLKPNIITYLSILTACSNAGNLEWGKVVHAHILDAGFQSDVRIGTALITMYANSGSIRVARQVFDKMVKRDVISWTAMIRGYAEGGRGKEAFGVYQLMQQEGGIEPDKITFMSILTAFASPEALEQGKVVHAQATKAGFVSDVNVGNALIRMYARCGSIKDARQIFDKMVRRDILSWNEMIGGLALHGTGQDALHIFEQMMREGIKPNEVTFVAVLAACSHAGLVDEGCRYFSSMSEVHGIVPTLEHYGCMVDLLGRAGRLSDAESIINNMPVEPDASIWGALLGACRIHGNVMLAERAAESSLKIDPQNARVYVLLSHIYAAAGNWDNATKVRKLMKDRGVKKEPGRSWIEVDSKVHSFRVEDRSHPQSDQIYNELKRLMKEMKRAGYVPDTQFVMHDVDDQQKEEAICHHSEKLAIAYGLISTPPGTTIRIFKNLRVCADCHIATKFISRIVGREIVARDANRYHHFKDGVCSCGDYW